MFTTPCFIRKNTLELRMRLEELGYENRHLSMVTNVEEYPLLQAYRDGFYDGIIGDECGLEFYIDCETNEELFLALAALRDDSPINSYYWFKDKLVICYNIFDLNINQNITYRFQSVDNPKICFSSNIDIMRKATVEEIIEHFKNK